jgi:serralysin
VGQSGTATEHFSAGYTVQTSLTLVNDSSVQVTSCSLSFAGNVAWSWTGAVPAGRTTLLTDLSDTSIFAGDDSIHGNQSSNVLQGWQGNDFIDGGAGIDTAKYSGSWSEYSYVQNPDGSVSVNGPDGADALVSVERLEFSDYGVAFDIQGTAGQAYRLYQAAFARPPDLSGLGYQINALESGLSLIQVGSNFIASPEFQAKYGNVDDTQFLTLLYQNVLHRAPDEGGLQYHLDEMHVQGQSRALELVHFSESPENQANVIGAIGGGILYVPLQFY